MLGRLFKIFSLACISYLFYLSIYPNDFFLPQKIFKNHPSFHFEKSFNHLIIYDKSKVDPNLQNFINHPDNYLKKDASLIKNNSKRTLAKLNINGKKIVIKRYNFKSWLDWISKCPFRSSKAYRYWYYAYQFKDKGINTVDPIAIIEKRLGPFWTHTYLIMDYLEGETLNELKNKKVLNEEDSSAIAEQLKNTLHKFNEQNWVHPDFKDKNIMVMNQMITILDLDEVHAYTFNNFFYKKKCLKKHIVVCP